MHLNASRRSMGRIPPRYEFLATMAFPPGVLGPVRLLPRFPPSNRRCRCRRSSVHPLVGLMFGLLQ